MNANLPRIRKNAVPRTPVRKSLHIARFLTAWLANPDARPEKVIANLFDRLERHLKSEAIVHDPSDRCYFRNRVASCKELFLAAERFTALYQMQELTRKLAKLDAEWISPGPVLARRVRRQRASSSMAKPAEVHGSDHASKKPL